MDKQLRPRIDIGSSEHCHTNTSEWITEFCERAETDDLPGHIGDAMDIGCRVEDIEGGINVYFAKPEDEFEISDAPSVTFWGERSIARRRLLEYLYSYAPLTALKFLSEKNPGLLHEYEWILVTPMQLFFGPEGARQLLAPIPNAAPQREGGQA